LSSLPVKHVVFSEPIKEDSVAAVNQAIVEKWKLNILSTSLHPPPLMVGPQLA
jgi:hypothetical protein